MISIKKNLKNILRPTSDKMARTGICRFDRNERTTLFSNKEFQDMLSTLKPLDFVGYGELEPFYKKVATWLDVKREEVLLTSGSDTSIRAIYETYIEEGDEVAILVPTYTMFSVYAKMFGAKEIQLKYNKDLTVDVDRIISKITDKTKLLAIANPNHTGTVISNNELLRIVEAAERYNCLVVIDEAYFHFYPDTMIQHIYKQPNLIIVRTFSKAFGLASLRIGVLISSKDNISNLHRVKLVHELTGVAAKIGSYLLDHLDIVESYVKEVNSAKEYLYNYLPSLGFDVLRSEANFIFFKRKDNSDGKLLVSELAKKKIYIKGPFTQYPFNGYLRVTVGDRKQMTMFCNELQGKCWPK